MAGLLDETHKQYYEGNNHGSYQFISLDDVITQFQIAYVGEDKIISKVKRADIAFHAHRAMQELSFDTFKSCKAQEITLPPSLQMILPHDYVNYTKISWSDSAGIKHPLYPTSNTSNPFNVTQDADGNYTFPSNFGLGANMDFIDGLGGTWSFSTPSVSQNPSVLSALGLVGQILDDINTTNGSLTFDQHVHHSYSHDQSKIYAVWQELDVTGISAVELSAVGEAQALATGIDAVNGGTYKTLGGTLKMGICLEDPNIWGARTHLANPSISYPNFNVANQGYAPSAAGMMDISYWNFVNDAGAGNSTAVSPLVDKGVNQVGADFSIPWALTQTGEKAYLQWGDEGVSGGESSVSKSLVDGEAVDLAGQDTVWVLVTSRVDYEITAASGASHPYSQLGGGVGGTAQTSARDTMDSLPGINSIDDIFITTLSAHAQLSSTYGASSETWENYKSGTPSENQTQYDDGTYQLASGKRYGLDPQHAQANGSFYIDCISGKIHFSSNIAGKTVILDYISDSLGTDKEMQVHKFAEEAMYKWIAHAILSTRVNTQEYIVNRFKKERFAAIRTAKLRLSNIKLEEITQILRGKSKQIKH